MTINCEKCKQPISSKSDLSSAWFFFKILPYHNSCFAEEKTKGKGLFLTGPINGFYGTIITIISSLMLIIFIGVKIPSIQSLTLFSIILLLAQLGFFILITYPRITSYFLYEKKLDNKEIIEKKIQEKPGNLEQRSPYKVYCETCNKEIKDVSSLIVSFHVRKYTICSFHSECFSKELKKATAGIKYSRTPINSTDYFINFGLKGFFLSSIIGIIGLGFLVTGIISLFHAITNPYPYINDILSAVFRIIVSIVLSSLLIFQVSGNYIIFTRKSKKIIQKIKNNN